MLDQLTHESFEPCVGQIFQATGGAADPQDLELVEVKVIGEPIPGVTSRPGFALLFHGPADVILPQAIYRFDNEELGSHEFMIVPLGPGEHGQRYEAIFN